VAGLAAVGAHVRDIREIVVTHIHPDHFGLAGRLAEESGARVVMHRLEAQIVAARYQDTQSLVEEMEAWLRIHGVPHDDLVSMAEGSLMMLRRVGTRRPDDVLDGGETLAWERSFELMWTPGHSAGLICLYDREEETFISSDHVLERISPHVGLHAQSFGNPLADYLDSLRLVRDLPVRLVLPGHGSPFTDLRGRVDELVAHHEVRSARIREELAGAERSAFEVAGRLSWRGSERGWDRLAPFQRRMAVTETIAHLEYMHNRGQIGKETHKGAILYSSSEPS